MDPDPSKKSQSQENLPTESTNPIPEIIIQEALPNNDEYSDVVIDSLPINADSGNSSETGSSSEVIGVTFVKPLPLDERNVIGGDLLDKNDDDSGKSGESDKNESADEGLSDAASNSSSGSHSHSNKGKKTNRCQVCRKKVGLTGFVCRCGGLFCSIHRYSDKHSCTFNYRELGAEEIRKNNPVVLGEKIHKI
jgi:hypothetical protein